MSTSPPRWMLIALGVAAFVIIGVAGLLYLNDRVSEAGAILAVAAGTAASSRMVQRGRDQVQVEGARDDVATGRDDVTDAVDAITDAADAGAGAHDVAADEIATLDREAKARLADELLGGDDDTDEKTS